MSVKKTSWYFLILNGQKIHSCHADKAVALQWMECKSHDGEDATIVEMDGESASDMANKIIEAQEVQG